MVGRYKVNVDSDKRNNLDFHRGFIPATERM